MARRSGSGRAVLRCAGALCLVGAAVAAAPAAAAPGLDATVAYLQRVQNPDGGFGGQPGGASDPTFSAWAAYALAAASINPQDQARPSGEDVFTYLTRHTAGLAATTDFDRVLLVALAAGTPAHDFGGADLVARILERQLPDGSFAQDPGAGAGAINATIWSILPLSAVPEPAAGATVDRAAAWLVDQENADGGFSWSHRETRSNVDTTGAAVQALRAAGRGGSVPEQRALTFLRATQNVDGGFPETGGGEESNTASTAWVVQGLWAAGIDPRTWRTAAGGDPLAFLASMQQLDGSIRWKRSADLNPIWMTAMAAPAFAGRWHPIPAVPRAVQPRAEPPPGAAGVGAGGGGDGAPLFSRPQPQSRGRRPGGVRRTRPTPRDAGRQSGTRPGEPPRGEAKRPRRRGDKVRARRDAAARRAAQRRRRDSAATGSSAGGDARDGRADRASAAAEARDRRADASAVGEARDRLTDRASTAGDARDRRAGVAPGTEVVDGRLIGGAERAAAAPAGDGLAAPGLRAAGVTRDTTGALALAVTLVVAATLGAGLERRRPRSAP
jgi:hypothetical protein